MDKLKLTHFFVIGSVITISSNVFAGGLTASGKIGLLSHEISGSYVQLLDTNGTIIKTDPDNCGGSEVYSLPTDHPNYNVLSSSLLTAEMTQKELALYVEGCDNGKAKVAFVRFGNWDGVNINTPTEAPSLPSTGDSTGNRSQTFAANGTQTVESVFTVPDGVNLVYLTMCGGGAGGGHGSDAEAFLSGGAGASAIARLPIPVTSSESINIVAGGGASSCSRSTSRWDCPDGKSSSFGSVVAPGAESPKYSGGDIFSFTVLPEGFSGDEPYLVEGGTGGKGGNSTPENRKGQAVLGRLGGSASGSSSPFLGGGGASFLGSGGDAPGGSGRGYCSGGAAGNGANGGEGAPGVVIVEW